MQGLTGYVLEIGFARLRDGKFGGKYGFSRRRKRKFGVLGSGLHAHGGGGGGGGGGRYIKPLNLPLKTFYARVGWASFAGLSRVVALYQNLYNLMFGMY
jgi:hypothetical protein